MANIYVDFGDASGTPESTFAGAAPESGVWNTVSTSGSAVSMVDTDGNATDTTLTLGDVLWYTGTATPSLLSDFIYKRSISITMDSLENGDYDLYVYGGAHFSFTTGDITVNGDTENVIDPVPSLGNPVTVTEWIEGTNYEKASVSVTDGSLTLSAYIDGNQYAAISGIQLVESIPEPATFAFIGLFGVGAIAIRRIFMM